VIACALYPALIDAVGAVYDGNAFFDGFPGSGSTDVYRCFGLILTFNKSKTIFAARIAPCCVIGLGNTQSIPCGHCLA